MSTSKNPRIFIDSSVLIAAAISPKGHARILLLRGLDGEEALFVSELVMSECERNLAKKAARALPAFAVFRALFEPSLVNPSKRLIEECLHEVDTKDAPIVAGARAAEADWIVSYDRRHLLSQREHIAERFNIRVGTPEEYLSR